MKTISHTGVKRITLRSERKTTAQDTILPGTGEPLVEDMVAYVRSALQSYWKDYLQDISVLMNRRYRQGVVATVEGAKRELELCKNYEGFLTLKSAEPSSSPEIAQKRRDLLRAVALMTTSLQRELSRCR